jgi:signal peptidase I
VTRLRTIAVAVCALCAAALLLPAAVGLRGYAITGRSMGDALPVGSLAFVRSVEAGENGTGDVVTFRPAARAGVVTHRVLGRDAGGLLTRGDANGATDPWRIAPGTQVQRVAFHVPLAGYAVAAARELALGLALFALAALVLVSVARDARRRTVTA